MHDHRAAGRQLAARARAAARPRGRREARGARLEPRSARDRARTVARSRPARSRRSAGKPAAERVFRPALRHLADRIGSRLRAKSRPGRTVTVRVRFADLRAVTRSLTLDAPISATAILAEIAEELVRGVLADHPEREDHLAAGDLGVAPGEAGRRCSSSFRSALDDEKRRARHAAAALARCARRPRRRPHPRSLRLGGGRATARWRSGLTGPPHEFRELAEKERLSWQRDRRPLPENIRTCRHSRNTCPGSVAHQTATIAHG